MQIEQDGDLVKDLEDRMDEALDELADEVEFEWRRTVARDLFQSRKDYFKGMSVERIGDEIQMNLSGDLAVAVEEGSSRFDLKPGFLKGKTYANIPLFGNRPPYVDRWRRVPSKKSQWIHPGIKPHRLIDKVQSKLDEDLVNEVFTRVLARTKI